MSDYSWKEMMAVVFSREIEDTDKITSGAHTEIFFAATMLAQKTHAPNLKLQLDLYHCQITEGDLTIHIRNLAGSYAHVQIAGVPDRHEPDHGEVNFAYALSVLDEIGYDGWVGCEYRPAAATSTGLGWAQRWGVQPRSQPQSN